MNEIKKVHLRHKFFTLSRQLCLPLVSSEVTQENIEKLTKAAQDDEDFDKLMNMLLGLKNE